MNPQPLRQDILQDLQVQRDFDAETGRERRIDFLARYIATSERTYLASAHKRAPAVRPDARQERLREESRERKTSHDLDQ